MSGTNFVFFGTPRFAVSILEILKQNGLSPALVVSAPDKSGGRGLKPKPPPVKIWAEKNNIPVLQPENLKSSNFTQELLNIGCLTAVVAAYGKIIPKEILDVFSKGILNVHPSLLPSWRGADPIRAVLLAGDEKTGVTIMLMDEKMDHGPILKHETLNLNHSENYSELEKLLAELGGKLLAEMIPKWLDGEIEPKEQDHSKATYTKKITKEDGHINWRESAELIERKIRALNPWPGTFAFWNGKRIKIIEAWSKSDLDHLPGRVWTKPGFVHGFVHKQDSELGITCGNGVILVKKLQLEGKKPQDAKDFLNGYPDIVGAILN